MAAKLMDVIDDLSLLSVQPIEPPISDLTIDIIQAEILPKLPYKSLMRFKAVCKSFNVLISSREFIRLHLRHSLSSDNRLLVTKGSVCTMDIYDLHSHSSAPSITFCWPSGSPFVVGSCNGLLLIVVDPYINNLLPLVLLNPTTRTYIEFQSTDTNVVRGNIGFGYDDSNDDYKIVVVSDKHNTFGSWRVTSIYSVNLKSWRVVDQLFTSDFMEEPYSWFNGLLINNHLLHWIFLNQSEHKRSIGCFNVISEKWGEDLHFPYYYYYDCNSTGYFLDVGVLNNSLFTSFVDTVNSFFDLWIMKEYGVNESWIKMLRFNIGDDPNGGVVPINKPFNESLLRMAGFLTLIEVPGGVIPVTYRGKGRSEVLLRRRRDSYTLFCYDWMNNAIVKSEIPNVYGRRPYFVRESLVRLPGAKLFGPLYQP
ncbi:F-box/kelch-repeat protein At3g23880-like [Silene latifolia]|uniref:F-box/kelch-repeat protein At3g23880-like n=1 Tax=Silene latifolia TaxID=37657 RepID=UPI003D78931E